MSKFLSAFGVAGGIFIGACNTCSGGEFKYKASQPYEEVTQQIPADGNEEEPSSFSLPKHDWNGLRVMMSEVQVRRVLSKIGFTIKPSRRDVFLTFDRLRGVVHYWKKRQEYTAMVIMEGIREKKILTNVWGMELVFVNNRLFEFSPLYIRNPVELVEPEDEYVTASDMEKKLRLTFGPPNVADGSTDIDVVVHYGEGKVDERKILIWSDDRLMVLFIVNEDHGILKYNLYFVSPEGMKRVENHLGRGKEFKARKAGFKEIIF